jgi:NAD(P)-dependent dehydrogenase (short-subunit alcohol dehydrogenase family)
MDIVARIKRKKGEAAFIKADVFKTPECEKLISRTISIYGSIDIACNNSAIISKLQSPQGKGSQEFDDEMGLDLSGLFCCMKLEIEAMQKQGGGIIINMSTILGAIRSAPFDSYAAAKYGMAGQMHVATEEDLYRGIRVHVIAPAFINAAMLDGMKPTERNRPDTLFMGSTGKIGEAARQVIWLSSHKAPFATGIY